MKLVVGLGNPGRQYETTRHNVGFLAIDLLAERFKAGAFADRERGEVAQCDVGSERVLLIKPQTFMNLSGRCVAPIARFFKVDPADILVIHDEVDLEPLSLRLKSGGGSGGHNGLKSLDEHLGSNAYQRVRIGVGHPRVLGLRQDAADWVLGQFTDEELKGLDPLLDRVAEAVEHAIRTDIKSAMNKFNAKTKESE